VGRNAIFTGAVFAVVGFIAAVYVLSWSSISNLPLALALLMCPAAIIGSMASGSETDPTFIWSLTVLNAILYGVVGIVAAKFLHLDDKPRRK
jgi:uncharacterized membrane protein YuzA (DUF378 family)